MKYLMICLLALAGCAHKNGTSTEFEARDPSSFQAAPNKLVCAYGFYLSNEDDCRPIRTLTVPMIAGQSAQCPAKYNVEGSTFGADSKAYWVCNLDR